MNCMQLRKETLVGAINDLTRMHTMAMKQKELLEEAAFVSVRSLVSAILLGVESL